jgi:quercetin dioxygenase-like cupin family protein
VFDLSKGGIVPRHRHKYEQVSYIVQGAVKVTTWDENGVAKEHKVRAGELIVLPPRTEHQFEAVDNGTVDIDFFTPARDDWKKGQEKYFSNLAKKSANGT